MPALLSLEEEACRCHIGQRRPLPWVSGFSSHWRQRVEETRLPLGFLSSPRIHRLLTGLFLPTVHSVLKPCSCESETQFQHNVLFKKKTPNKPKIKPSELHQTA